ncbi:MAG: proline iminopeptidase-family hydrolase [Sneathiella sp.]
MSEDNYQTWDRLVYVKVPGGQVACYIYNDDPALPSVIALNGGPGVPCDYIRESHSFLADNSYRFITFDQLGTGSSDRSNDTSLYTLKRYCEEVDAVRKELVDGPAHLLGHSWGGWLAIEYACSYGENLLSLILEDTCADIPFLVSELNRLRSELGMEIFQMMLDHEAAGTFEHPEYKAAITLLDYRHVCRLKERPTALHRSVDNISEHIYEHMQGPNEFVYTGELANWNRVEDIKSVHCPVLIIVGQFDEITSNCAQQMYQKFPNAKMELFLESSHTPFFEEPVKFRKTLLQFLDIQQKHA